MKPDIFKNTNVIVQGITGNQGSFHTKAMIDAGTNIVGGTSPTKTGTFVHGAKVYAKITDIQAEVRVDISIIFVPAPFAKSAILEAIDAGIPLIICITEGIPIHDMLYIKQHIKGKSSTLVGPNCPGILLPGTARFGIIPDHMGLQGSVGIVSRSGTLTYETMAGLTAKKVGQKYVIGIGGDPIKGTSFIDCLALFENDPDVSHIVMIGEIGGTEELEAAKYIEKSITKPVYTYIAGHHAPPGVQLGHAGAILGSEMESAAKKTEVLESVHCMVAESIVKLIDLVVKDITSTRK